MYKGDKLMKLGKKLALVMATTMTVTALPNIVLGDEPELVHNNNTQFNPNTPPSNSNNDFSENNKPTTTSPAAINIPILTNHGQSSYTIYQGKTFTLPLVTAWDKEDGNLGEIKPIITNPQGLQVLSINTNTTGTYRLTYRAVDSEGNDNQLVIPVTIFSNTSSSSNYSTSSSSSSQITTPYTYGSTTTVEINVSTITSNQVSTAIITDSLLERAINIALEEAKSERTQIKMHI